MIYNKTCLYSATDGQSTVNLSEPLSAFERYIVKVSPGVYWESVCSADRAVQRFNRYGDWNHQGYMNWPANWVISNGTKTMTCNRFQMIWQNSAVNKVGAFGWGNTASNIKHMYEVWGINRKEPIETEGSGKPEGEGWKAYDETLLWSGTDYANQSHIDLSGRALEYERLKIGVGSFGESTNIYDVDAPQSYTSWLPLNSYWGTTTGSFYLCMHRYKWDNETSGLSAVSGKAWQLGTGAADPFSTTGNYTATDSFIRRPVWAIWGINHKKPHKFVAEPSEGGTVSSDRVNGYENDIGTITVIPSSDEWKQSALNITGATLTGNEFIYETTDVSAKAEFEHSRDLTLINSEHGTLSADAMSGFSGDVVTVDATTDEGWYFTGMNVTGATATGNKFTFVGNDVTAEGLYTDAAFPITYENDGHGTLTGDPIYIPGSTGVTLQTAYNTYYRFSGYEVTGGTIENNVLVATGPCTARAVYKVNAFTATGGWEKGSDLLCQGDGRYTTNPVTTANLPMKYALHGAHTGDIPASWYSTSNRWNPSNASAYNATLKPIAKLSGYRVQNESFCVATANMVMRVAGANTQAQDITFGKTKETKTYSKNFTTTSQSLYGISGKFNARGWSTTKAFIKYLSSGTTGTWTATGIAP